MGLGTSDGTALENFNPLSKGTTVEIADRSFWEVKGYGKLELFIKHPGGVKTVTLEKVALVPDLGLNWLSAKQASRMWGN